MVSEEELKIINKLVGNVSRSMASEMFARLQSFLHPDVSLFIPSTGYCPYAAQKDHTHPAYTFMYFFQPVSALIVRDKRRSFPVSEEKCLLAMSPDIPHQEVQDDYFQSYIAIVINRALFDRTVLQYTKTIPVYEADVFVPRPELLPTLRNFMTATYSANTELISAIALSIVHFCIQSTLTESTCFKVPESMHHVPLYDRFEVDTAISFMNSHLAEKLTLEDIARQAGNSPTYFSKKFKQITELTPIEFLAMLRLQKASVMLISGTEPITDIAFKCGFNSSSYFSTCFLDKYHISPSDYRRLHSTEKTQES